MTSLGIIARRGIEQTAKWAAGFGLIRLSVLLVLTVIGACSTDAAIIIVQSLSDAFLQVTVFVAATLVIFYFIEAWYRIDVTSLLSRFQVWQVPIAAGLGALPGCGGAIMVITQYIRGGISFGSVVSVLTSTMGDAAFLLLATAPEIGISIFGIGFLVGIASGYTVDAIHGNGFLRQRSKNPKETSNSYTRRIDSRWWRYLWTAFLIPGLIFGGFVAFQADTSVIFGVFMGIETVVWVGLGGAIVSLMLWGITPPTSNKISPKASGTLGWASASTRRLGDAPARVVGDTCFVTVWVVFAYLIYELGIYFLEIDLKQIFQIWAPLVPFIAILVGFIPGCGPQLVVATMYLNGLVPFSAEVGNAISNDGDALFPAIAMAPKAAIIATLYSAFPALLVAYCYYWLFE